MEKNPNPGKQRIKNITKDVESYKQNPEDTKDIAWIKSRRARHLSVNQSTQPMFSEQEEREIQELAEHIEDGSSGEDPSGYDTLEIPYEDETESHLPEAEISGGSRSGWRRKTVDMAGDFADVQDEAQTYSGRKHGKSAGGGKPAGYAKSRDHVKPGRRRGTGSQLVPKLTAVVLVLVIAVVAVLVMRNYSAGASSNAKGNKLFLEEDYAGAVAAYEQALDYDHKNSSYYINLGMAYTGIGDYENAMAAFASAREHTSDGKLLQMIKRGEGIAYLHQGYYSKAQELFEEALGKMDGTYTDTELDILYYLAEAQDRAGDAVGAVLTYTEIINQKPDADAYMLRGLAYQRVGDSSGAQADLDRAIGMRKKNYKTYLALYDVLMDQGKEDEAYKALEAALELGGKNGEDYSNRGIVYMYLGDYEKARQAFNEALEKDYTAAYLGVAESLIRQGNYDDALVQYVNYLNTDMKNASAFNQYGICLMQVGRYEEAADIFARGLALNDRLVDRQLMFNEAVAYEHLARWDVAYEKMKAFMEKYPDDESGQRELTFLESRI